MCKNYRGKGADVVVEISTMDTVAVANGKSWQWQLEGIGVLDGRVGLESQKLVNDGLVEADTSQDNKQDEEGEPKTLKEFVFPVKGWLPSTHSVVSVEPCAHFPQARGQFRPAATLTWHQLKFSQKKRITTNIYQQCISGLDSSLHISVLKVP